MSPPNGRAPVAWGFPVLVGLFLLLCYLLTFPGTIAPSVSDGRAMYMVTQSLVDRHDVAVRSDSRKGFLVTPGWRPLPLPGGACATEKTANAIGERPGGPYFTKYGLGQSLLATPLYALGGVIGRAFPVVSQGASGINRAEVQAAVTSAYDPLVTALTAVLLCGLALRLGWSRRVGLALALTFGLATPAWAYTATFFSEPTIALCLIGALAAILWSTDGPTPLGSVVCGGWLSLALLTHLADSLLYVAVFGAYLLVEAIRRNRWENLAAFSAPLVLALLVTADYNLARFGGIMSTGYGIVGDYHDLHPPRTLQGFWEGIYGPVLSPGKGVLLYAPILFAAAWAWPRFRRRQWSAAGWLCLALSVAAVLGHANTLIVWLGGWAWGPRFVVPILPLAILPLGAWLAEGSRIAWRLTWALGALGLLIQIPALLLDYSVYIAHLRDTVPGRCIWQAEDLYKWRPQYSPLIGQWERLFDSATYQGVPRPSAQTIAGGAFTPSPHPWWSLLADQGVSHGWVALAAGALGLAAFGALILVARAAARDG
ncbi:MAG TPA: hypothetical protein VNL71_01565 [Chloroflexota bacterium]|nr:hypothetical protein [Chloroflexota bacterium]